MLDPPRPADRLPGVPGDLARGTACANPRNDIEGVELPTHVWTSVARLDPPRPGADADSLRWVPLILALDWSESHPDEPPPRPGPELLRELIERIGRGAGMASDPAREAE